MKRREFITLVGGAAAGWPLAVRAQQLGKLPYIGVLVSASPPHPFADAFWRGLHTLGYSEVTDVRIGKVVDLHLADVSRDSAQTRVREMCERLLANGVIEDFTFTIDEAS